MTNDEQPARLTIRNLRNGVYEHVSHAWLADRGMRRYHPYSFDFDSIPMNLEEPKEAWDEAIKTQHALNRAKIVDRLKLEYGDRDIEPVVENMRDLGPKGMSLITYHNEVHQQARKAFVICAYYPALVGACALGERILNHLILDLRGFFKTSSHDRRVHSRGSLQDW